MVTKKYSAWRKNNIREIKHTWERYMAIVAIIILGVGFFAGLRITKDAMVTTLDSYLNQYNMYDYRLLSTLGFDKEDAKYFSSLEGIETSEGGITIDFIADIGDERDLVIKAHSIGDTINQIQLLSGRLPSNSNEILVDSGYFLPEDLNKTIIVSAKNEKETIESFTTNEYTIVGIVKSSNYLSQQRGTTKLASGTINGFAYIPKDGFIIDYYTDLYLKLEENGVSYSKEYKDLISGNEDRMKESLDLRAHLRYEDIIDEANEKIKDAQEKYQEAYDEYLEEKLKVNEELDDAYEKLNNAKNEIKENEQKLFDGEKKLQDGWKEYEDGLKEYKDSLAEFEALKVSTLKTFDKNQKEITDNRNKVNTAIKEIDDSGVLNQYQELTQKILSLENAKLEIEKSGVLESYARLQESLKQLEDSEDKNTEEIALIQNSIKEIESSGVLYQYKELNQAIPTLENAKLQIEKSDVLESYAELQDSLIQLDAGQKELDNGINTANLEFEKARKQLKQGKAELDRGKEQLLVSEKEIQEAKIALEKGKKEYEKGLFEYKKGKEEAEEGFAEAKKELENAKREIDDGKKEIEDIKAPTTYVFNRSHNTGYNSFENDSSIIAGIAKLLPIFFFLVAALVCSTTMARMVDEQRTQIGTLKSLGYSNRKITNKYMFYSGSAAILGWIIGYLIGTKLFPMAIWAAYGMLYNFAPIEYIFDIRIAITSLIASLLSSAGITYLTCKNELIKMPAQLIRPKAPKAGKRIFLEKIPFIWERVGFLHKVTIRNIFRYKKRLFMTILGVAGCTALILAALGIKDSVSNIADDQFDKIMTYDYEIYFTEEQKQEDQNYIKEKYSHIVTKNVFVVKETWEIEVNNQTKIFQAIATDDPNITNIINFNLNGKNIPYPEDGKVIINDKLAKEANASIGDTLTIKLSDTDKADALIGGIFENHVDNYMFMTENTYEMIFNEKAEYKNAFASSKDEDIEKITQMLGNEKEVAAISVLSNVRNVVNDMMESLNYIIWLVIACAAALAFVVIYNLNNINITERTREIATIKVLGFYSNETYSYVYRENIVLTTLGILLGLGLGMILHKLIMAQLVVDLVSFKEQIFPLSYILAIIITFLLTIIVNLILKRKINYINMAESLKSVE